MVIAHVAGKDLQLLAQSTKGRRYGRFVRDQAHTAKHAGWAVRESAARASRRCAARIRPRAQLRGRRLRRFVPAHARQRQGAAWALVGPTRGVVNPIVVAHRNRFSAIVPSRIFSQRIGQQFPQRSSACGMTFVAATIDMKFVSPFQRGTMCQCRWPGSPAPATRPTFKPMLKP